MAQAITAYQQRHNACKQSFGDLVSQYQPLLYKKAYEVLQDHYDAEDAVQEALLKAYQHFFNYSDERRKTLKAQAWLCTIVQTTALNMRRDKKHHASLDTTEGSEHLEIADTRFEPPEVALMREETWGAVYQLVSTLPTMIRFLMRLRFILEYKYDALALFLRERLGWEEMASGALRTRVSRSLALLRSTLETAGINISDLDAWSEWSTVFDEPTDIDEMLSVERYTSSYLDLHLCSPRQDAASGFPGFHFDARACTLAFRWVFCSRGNMINEEKTSGHNTYVESTLVDAYQELLPSAMKQQRIMTVGPDYLTKYTIASLLEKGLVPHISATVSQSNLAGLPELLTHILERELCFTLNDCREHCGETQYLDKVKPDASLAGDS